MEVEYELSRHGSNGLDDGTDHRSAYPFDCAPPGRTGPALEESWVVDWGPMIRGMMFDLAGGVPRPEIVSKFHVTLGAFMVRMAAESGESQIMLSGGCFQNRYLTENAVARLREKGYRVYWHQRVPPNDGGLALGQVLAAALRKDR